MAINFGINVEFYGYIVSLKVAHNKPRGASTYFEYETRVGFEISLLF